MKRVFSLLCCFGLIACMLAPMQPALAGPSYRDTVLADQPVAYWQLDRVSDGFVTNQAGLAKTKGLSAYLNRVTLQAGPRPKRFLNFDAKNKAASFDVAGQFIEIKDPGAGSVLDFDKGDSITLEAWVYPRSIRNDAQVYIIGKGRTGNKGFASNNQNWAMRLRGVNGECRLSFLFRGAANRPSSDPKSRLDWHRWNSKIGFAPNSGWHHVAVSYTFGDAKSIAGYIDGRAVKGGWDYGGATDKAPVVDDDQVWIGSSMGGSANSTLDGLIDEIAIYRKVVSGKRIALRYKVDPKIAPSAGTGAIKSAEAPTIKAADLPSDAVVVQLISGIPDKRSWSFKRGEPSVEYQEPAFGFVRFPRRYDEKGLRSEWSNPFILRAAGKVTLPKGKHQILLRTRNGAKLYMDGKTIATASFTSKNASGHDKVPKLAALAVEGMRVARAGHYDRVIEINSPGGEHVFVLEFFLGGQKLRQEIGETSVSILLERDDKADAGNHKGRMFELLGPRSQGRKRVPLTDEHWEAYAAERGKFHDGFDTQRRIAAGAKEADYWARRHEMARKYIKSLPPIFLPDRSSDDSVINTIDLFISEQLAQAKIKPAALIDDMSFVRRATLDVLGVVPSPAIIDQFLNDKSDDRRAKLIDRLLKHPRWADHWVGYWQDVLAENPGILKPMLNNTGPFRWWIHESFLDNKPVDRFATELIMMQGSKYGGGPAGFSMATQNDVPMAAKAHTIGQAFLAINMKCARCHDAPYHDLKQKHLFSMAAMLKRGVQAVPKSSSVPVSKERLKRMIIEVTLKPGAKVKPDWPFEQLVSTDSKGQTGKPSAEALTGVAINTKDSRRQLADLITSPANGRFARVMVNRLWRRYLGHGLNESVDDWETGRVSHPKLLDYLARELMSHNYDLKHVARLILNSHTYQRAITKEAAEAARTATINKFYLFASPVRKRMSAEQLVDSLFAVAGKEFKSEELNLDVDGRRPINTFLNLGVPSSAWQFTSLSNERDRPALAMPKAQGFVDMLSTFGWRQSRQNPITKREDITTVLQPAMLANGIVTRRAVGLSEDSALTALALEDQAVEQLVDAVFIRVLSRKPGKTEAKLFVDLLTDGYKSRRAKPSAEAILARARGKKHHAVSWSNHLNAEATRIKIEMEAEARAGDPPTLRLQEDWRMRMEDMVWALVNSPEFVFVP